MTLNSPQSQGFDPALLRHFTPDQLETIARQFKLDPTGSKEQLIDRITESRQLPRACTIISIEI